MENEKALGSLRTRFFLPFVLGALSVIGTGVAFIFVCAKVVWPWLRTGGADMNGGGLDGHPLMLFLLTAALLVLFAVFSAKYFKDFRYVINEEYMQVSGTVISVEVSAEYGEQYITIQSAQDASCVRVGIGNERAEVGETCRIIYLPNTKTGAITYWLGNH